MQAVLLFDSVCRFAVYAKENYVGDLDLADNCDAGGEVIEVFVLCELHRRKQSLSALMVAKCLTNRLVKLKTRCTRNTSTVILPGNIFQTHGNRTEDQM